MDVSENRTVNRNNSIDLFRYVAALMVVLIHSHFWSEWGVVGDFIGNILPRIAVPFFFAVTGYFYIGGILSDKKVFLKNFKHILLVYGVWSIIYYAVAFLYDVIFSHGSVVEFVKEIPLSFFISGSTQHFWYFPALVISLVLVELFRKLKLMKLLIPISIVFYLIGCLGTSYYSLGNAIPVFSDIINADWFNILRRILFMGFPFVSAGFLLRKLQDKVSEYKNILLLGWIVAALFFLAEIYIIRYFSVAISVMITLGLYPLLILTMLLLLDNPLPKYSKQASACRVIANVTYYSHPLIIQLFAIVSSLSGIKLPNLLVIACTVVITFLAGVLFNIILKKTDNKVIKGIVRAFVG